MRVKNSFEDLRKKFREFYVVVRDGHEQSKRAHRGHGLDHDVTVAQIAVMIAPDERTAEKAWCAAMLHSTDRLVEKGNKEKEEAHMRANLKSLPERYFTSEEKEEIFLSAYRHEELNQDDQSVTQHVLMDADRLANLMPAVIIRAGQLLSDIPALELEYLEGKRNPKTTYHEPKSVLDDLRNNVAEYTPKLRMPKAKELAMKYVKRLDYFIKSLER
ncbi:MAG: HD domain-containing protein, partial [Patescibacteria group bacterium]|nr:HD domain-containing protein [Patescibacteria group bacterium]